MIRCWMAVAASCAIVVLLSFSGTAAFVTSDSNTVTTRRFATKVARGGWTRRWCCATAVGAPIMLVSIRIPCAVPRWRESHQIAAQVAQIRHDCTACVAHRSAPASRAVAVKEAAAVLRTSVPFKIRNTRSGLSGFLLRDLSLELTQVLLQQVLPHGHRSGR